jgi:hypothetical protein
MNWSSAGGVVHLCDGQPHHGGKATQYKCSTTYDQVHGLDDGANGANGVAPIKTTAWGGLHGFFALVLDNVDYATVSCQAVILSDCLVQPPVVNPAIKDNTPQHKLLRLQAETKDLQKAFEL